MFLKLFLFLCIIHQVFVWKPHAKAWFWNTVFRIRWYCQRVKNLLTLMSLGFCRDKQEEIAPSLCCYKDWETKSSDTDTTVTSKSHKICFANKMTVSFAVVCTKHSCSLYGLRTFSMKINDCNSWRPKETEDSNDKSQPRPSHHVGGDVEGNILAFRETTVSWDLSLYTDHCLFLQADTAVKVGKLWLCRGLAGIGWDQHNSPLEMCLHDTGLSLRRFCRAGQSYLDAYYAVDSRYFGLAVQPLSTKCFSTSSNTKANSLLSQMTNLKDCALRHLLPSEALKELKGK